MHNRVTFESGTQNLSDTAELVARITSKQRLYRDKILILT